MIGYVVPTDAAVVADSQKNVISISTSCRPRMSCRPSNVSMPMPLPTVDAFLSLRLCVLGMAL